MGGICPLSDIRANTISNAAGTGPIDLHKQSAAKAYGGVDAAGAIQTADTLNISSTSDEGGSVYKYNFTSSMNNPSTFSAASVSTSVRIAIVNGRNSAYVTVKIRNGSFSPVDQTNMITAHGELA